MLSKYVWENIAQKFTCAMLAQSAKKRFRWKTTFTMFSWSACINIAHKTTCAMLILSPRRTLQLCLGQHCTRESPMQCLLMATFMRKITYTMLGQYCIGILSSQCCPNMSDTTLHKKAPFAMSTQTGHQRFWRKIINTILFWSAGAKIAQNNNLYNAERATRVL